MLRQKFLFIRLQLQTNGNSLKIILFSGAENIPYPAETVDDIPYSLNSVVEDYEYPSPDGRCWGHQGYPNIEDNPYPNIEDNAHPNVKDNTYSNVDPKVKDNAYPDIEEISVP